LTPFALSFKNLSVTYGQRLALENITLTINPGSLCAIIGPNGSGKSTLLKAIMGIAPAVTGTLSVTKCQRHKIAYLPQLSELDRHFPINVFDTVAMGLLKKIGPFKKYTDEDKDKILHALSMVGMQDFKDNTLHALSGGQFQRILFARAILQDAHIFLLDEPFTGVDTATTKILMDIILDWHKKGKTVLAVIHDYPLVKAYFPESILLARTMIAEGKTEDVITDDNLLKAHVSLDYIQHHQTGDA
jgi:zinc/manganese transport system ATP-binding protein